MPRPAWPRAVEMTTREIFRLVKDIMGERLEKAEELVARASRPFLASPPLSPLRHYSRFSRGWQGVRVRGFL